MKAELQNHSRTESALTHTHKYTHTGCFSLKLFLWTCFSGSVYLFSTSELCVCYCHLCLEILARLQYLLSRAHLKVSRLTWSECMLICLKESLVQQLLLSYNIFDL